MGCCCSKSNPQSPPLKEPLIHADARGDADGDFHNETGANVEGACHTVSEDCPHLQKSATAAVSEDLPQHSLAASAAAAATAARAAAAMEVLLDPQATADNNGGFLASLLDEMGRNEIYQRQKQEVASKNTHAATAGTASKAQSRQYEASFTRNHHENLGTACCVVGC